MSRRRENEGDAFSIQCLHLKVLEFLRGANSHCHVLSDGEPKSHGSPDSRKMSCNSKPARGLGPLTLYGQVPGKTCQDRAQLGPTTCLWGAEWEQAPQAGCVLPADWPTPAVGSHCVRGLSPATAAGPRVWAPAPDAKVPPHSKQDHGRSQIPPGELEGRRDTLKGGCAALWPF